MNETTKAIAIKDAAEVMEQVITKGDLKDLTPAERVTYYRAVCDSIGVNPLTKPFEYLMLNNRLVLYATRNCTDQLREGRNVSTQITGRETINGVYVVTAKATLPDGRSDESIGAVSIEGLKGDALANALMKAETKGKRRVTLSIVGLSFLDETEIETIPNAQIVPSEPIAPKPAAPRAAKPSEPTPPSLDDESRVADLLISVKEIWEAKFPAVSLNDRIAATHKGRVLEELTLDELESVYKKITK